MPKAIIDHRVVRAVLCAPYPLPIIITRNALTRSPSPDSSHEAYHPIIPDTQSNSTYHGFPVYNPHWRSLPPAIPPVPYPLSEGSKQKRRSIKLKKLSDRETESSDFELMSGIEAGCGNELTIIKRLNDVALGQSPRGAVKVNIGLYCYRH